MKWGKLLRSSSKDYMDQEVPKALERLSIGVDIPTPLQSMYKYWEEGFMQAL